MNGLRRNKAWLIFAKEVRVLLRDRRMVLGIVLGGLVVFPLLMALIGRLGEGPSGTVSVVLFRPDATLLEAAESLEGVELMVRGEEAVVPEMPDGPRVSAGVGTDGYWVEAGRTNSGAWVVARALEAELLRVRDVAVRDALTDQGVSPAILEPWRVDLLDSAGARERSAAVLAVLIPYLAIILLVSNGIRATYIAVGEKEKNTLASLLVTSVPRSSIVLGKALAVMLVAMSASVLLVVGMVIFAALGLSPGATAGGTDAFHPGAGLVALLGLNLLALSLLVSGAIMAIGTYARTQREAGFYTAPFLFLCIFLAVFSFSPRQFATWTYWVPVLGNALAMRDAILDLPAVRHTVMAAAGSVALFVALIGVSARMYRRETILFRR